MLKSKRSRGIHKNKCKYCNTLHEPRRCLAYGMNCTGLGRVNHFEWVSRRVTNDTIREKYRKVHDTHQDLQEKEVSTEEFDCSKIIVFNFHSIQSIISAKLNTKTSQSNELCEYKIDTHGHGNLIPFRMFRALFSDKMIMDLNKSRDKK